jgi:hypothetical protein
MREVFAIMWIVGVGCAAASPDYRVGALEDDWRPFAAAGSDVAYKHKDGGTIFANRLCSSAEDVPLDVLTNHLFFDMKIAREISREEITLAGRAALRTHVIAELDGVPVELDLVVLKKDGCTYDMALVSDQNSYQDRRADFEVFLRGFERVGQG